MCAYNYKKVPKQKICISTPTEIQQIFIRLVDRTVESNEVHDRIFKREMWEKHKIYQKI